MNSGLGLLQMVLEPATEHWPPKGGLWDPTSIWEGNKHSYKGVETLRVTLKPKIQRGQYLLALGLDRYIMNL